VSRQLKDYIEDHCGYKITTHHTNKLFDYYNQLRIHRNNLVHPGKLEKSSIPILHTLNDLEKAIDKMIALGQSIIDVCEVYEFSNE